MVIIQWLLLLNIYNIQVFIRFTRFYCCFIKQYLIITAPLIDLLKGNTKGPITINVNIRVVFKQLKSKFTIVPLLYHFNLALLTQIYTDFSRKGIRAVLLQLFKGYQHLVVFKSYKLTPTKTYYNIRDKELLTIINILYTQRYYIIYTIELVTILTNYLNLQYLDIK